MTIISQPTLFDPRDPLAVDGLLDEEQRAIRDMRSDSETRF